MERSNLERAAQLHLKKTALLKAHHAILTIAHGDEQGNDVVDDTNMIELEETNSRISLELKGCEIGDEILSSIKDVIEKELEVVLGEADTL